LLLILYIYIFFLNFFFFKKKAIVSSLNIPDFVILTKHAKILHIFNGEDDDTTKRMVNVSNTNVMNVKDSNVTINNILEKNGQKGQFGSTTVTSNIENLNDPNNSSPNYDIDKFITISKVCIYIITLIF